MDYLNEDPKAMFKYFCGIVETVYKRQLKQYSYNVHSNCQKRKCEKFHF